MYFYISFVVAEPWDNDNVKVFAAGDDVIVFCDPQLATPIQTAILHLSSRDREDREIGLG